MNKEIRSFFRYSSEKAYIVAILFVLSLVLTAMAPDVFAPILFFPPYILVMYSKTVEVFGGGIFLLVSLALEAVYLYLFACIAYHFYLTVGKSS